MVKRRSNILFSLNFITLVGSIDWDPRDHLKHQERKLTKPAFSVPSAHARSSIGHFRIAQKNTTMRVRVAVFANKRSKEGQVDPPSSAGKALRLLVKPHAQSSGTQIAVIAACGAGY
jgi:hypothetical protein